MDSAGVQIDLAAAPAPLPQPDIVEESSFNASEPTDTLRLPECTDC